MEKIFKGNIINPLTEEIYPGEITVSEGIIKKITRSDEDYSDYILPGFVDSHIHIESSMLVPSEFAKKAVTHGTVAAVCDPHEIANVSGLDGIRFMVENAKSSPMKMFFSAPSCVPATGFETSGAVITPEEIENLFRDYPEIKFLGEMMNFPGVIGGDSDVMQRIEIARKSGKKIDGHAPVLRGDDLKKYIAAGIDTDHESGELEEALEKLSLGMKIWIREGSAARNLDALLPLLDKHFKNCGFCSDDKHPDDLVKGHINISVKKALNNGYDLMKVLYSACVTPVLHYGLDVGLLREGDSADFIITDNIETCDVKSTVIGGETVFNGKNVFAKDTETIQTINNFDCKPKAIKDFRIPGQEKFKIIEAFDGSLFTASLTDTPKIENGEIVSDLDNDYLKIAVINRYEDTPPALGLIKNFGLKKGAIASTVAHDSHNIIAVAADDESLLNAVNALIEAKGGIVAINPDESKVYLMPLPVGGLMSSLTCDEAAQKYTEIDQIAKDLGTKLRAPFMTLSFMALLVIPELKLSDKGLFDGKEFRFV
jgi:adenine deaminase